MRETRSLSVLQTFAPRTVLTVLLALTLGVLGGCASTRGQTEPRTPGNFIDDEAIETLAIREIAAKIRKARTIHNEIEISGPISRVARSNDAWLTSKVKSRLLARRDIRGVRTKVVTENSIVYLMGLVTRDHAQKSVEVAQKVFGVQKIVKVFEYID